MAFGLPSSLGPFSIDDAGRIAPRAGADMPQFLFYWRDRRVSAQLLDQVGSGQLILSACLGRVPSSADTGGAMGVATGAAERRTASFGNLRDFLDVLPGEWRVRLTPDHRVRLDTEMALAWPASAVELMAELTRFLLALAPYLDLLDEVDVLEPVAAAPLTPEVGGTMRI